MTDFTKNRVRRLPRLIPCCYWFPSEGIDDLFGREVLLPARVLRKQLPGSMLFIDINFQNVRELGYAYPQKLMVGDLELEGSSIPFVVKCHIVRMDEGELLIYETINGCR